MSKRDRRSVKEVMAEANADARFLLVEGWRLIWRHRMTIVLYVILLYVLVSMLLPADHAFYRSFDAHKEAHSSINRLAKRWRTWGGFYDTLAITVGVYAAGLVFRKRSWRVAALACFLGACLAGAAVNSVRWTAGRARPHAELPDRLYGPSFDDKKQSFPSGHSGTSSGGAFALLVALPPVGVPAVVSAGGVMWASAYKGRHYVTDCVAGAGLGLFFGVALGLTARRRCREVAA